MIHRLARGGRETDVRVDPDGAGYRVAIGGRVRHVEGAIGRSMRLLVDARPVEASVRRRDGAIVVELRCRHYVFRPRDPRMPKLGARPSAADAARGELHAPMPGLVVEVLARVGDAVEAGRPVVVVEAMKMQNALGAPLAGRVASIHVAAGTAVESGQLLVAIDPGEPGGS